MTYHAVGMTRYSVTYCPTAGAPGQPCALRQSAHWAPARAVAPAARRRLRHDERERRQGGAAGRARGGREAAEEAGRSEQEPGGAAPPARAAGAPSRGAPSPSPSPPHPWPHTPSRAGAHPAVSQELVISEQLYGGHLNMLHQFFIEPLMPGRGTAGTVQAVPGRLSAVSVVHSKSSLYGAFICSRRVLNGLNRPFLARPVA